MTTAKPRRLVTGHDAAGRSIFISDTAPERENYMQHHRLRSWEIWNTRNVPAQIEPRASEPSEAGVIIAPPKKGTRIRVCDFEPEPTDAHEVNREAALKDFASVGGLEAYQGGAEGAHPMMHRTETIDYGIVLEGEIYLVLEQDERLLRAGDIVVQVGTNHAWANRSDRICRMAFVLVDGEFARELAA